MVYLQIRFNIKYRWMKDGNPLVLVLWSNGFF